MNLIQILKNLTKRQTKNERLVAVLTNSICLNLYSYPLSGNSHIHAGILDSYVSTILTNHGPVKVGTRTLVVDRNAPKIAYYHPAYLHQRYTVDLYDPYDAILLKMMGVPDHTIEIHTVKVEKPYWEKYCKTPVKTLSCGLNKHHHKGSK